jgi:hypothetical protein
MSSRPINDEEQEERDDWIGWQSGEGRNFQNYRYIHILMQH